MRCGLSIAPNLREFLSDYLPLRSGIIGLRPEMRFLEKLAWIAILITFTVLEVRAINASDAANIKKQEALNSEFRTIADSLNTTVRLQQSLLQSNRELALLVRPLTKKDAFKKKALILSTSILQALLAGQVPMSSLSAVGIAQARVNAADQLSKTGYPAKIKEICDEFKAYGLSCTEPAEPESTDLVTRFQTEAQGIADLAAKL